MARLWLVAHGASPKSGFPESNAWICTGFVPHDVDGLVEATGDAVAIVVTLDRSFDEGRFDFPSESNAPPVQRHSISFYYDLFVIESMSIGTYVQIATRHGTPLDRLWLSPAEINAGGSRVVSLGEKIFPMLAQMAPLCHVQ